ncbi:MAG: ABC transporter permease [Anaerolineae bacterium]
MRRRVPGDLALTVGGLVLWDLLMALFNLGARLWGVTGLLHVVGFFVLARAVERRVPPRAQTLYERALTVIFPLLLLGGWEYVARAELINPQWFPPPSRIAGALWDLTVNYDQFTKTSLLGRPWLIPRAWVTEGWPGVVALLAESHVLATLMRVFAGFALGAIPGLILGVIMGMSRLIRVVLDPIVSALYVLPKIAIFPLLMLIFPNPFGEGPKIAGVAIAAFFLVLVNTMVGVRDIDPVYLEAGRNYGANRWQMFRHVIIPGALPVIFAGLRLALGTALIVIVAIEFVRAKKGVGYLTLYYWEVLVTEKMYAGLLVVMALGILLTSGLQWLERRLMPWHREQVHRG